MCLYVGAAFCYPGGSQQDKYAKGFSWMHNYWCNLMNENAMNGQPNTARPIALGSLVLLCIALAGFWIIFPQHAPFTRKLRLLFQLSGIASMLTGVFIFTRFHDVLIDISTLLGLVALTGTFIGLYKLRWKGLFWMGIFTLLLIALNNLLYYREGLLYYLPLVQKITFGYVLLWICLINIRLYRQS